MPRKPIRFEGDEHLSPSDNLFARVALRNKLVTKSEVEKCVKEVLAERAQYGFNSRLPDVFVRGGHMDEAAVERVDKAISEKLDERQGSNAPGGMSIAIKASEIRRAMEDREAKLVWIVDKAVKSPVHADVLRYVHERKIDALSVKEIAARVRHGREEVKAVFADWRKAGLVKRTMAVPNSYQPDEKAAEAIDIFCKSWRDRHWHTRLLGMILGDGKKKR